MAEKHASAHWEGAGKAGTGKISTETGALAACPYGFAIDRIVLTLKASVPGIDDATFQQITLIAPLVT